MSKQPQGVANEATLPVLLEFYNGEAPSYVVKAGKSFIIIRVSDWQGQRDLKITLSDLVEYYRSPTNNEASGSRTLAGHIGDWRQIDSLAQEVSRWFQQVNLVALRREARKAGLEPWF